MELCARCHKPCKRRIRTIRRKKCKRRIRTIRRKKCSRCDITILQGMEILMKKTVGSEIRTVSHESRSGNRFLLIQWTRSRTLLLWYRERSPSDITLLEDVQIVVLMCIGRLRFRRSFSASASAFKPLICLDYDVPFPLKVAIEMGPPTRCGDVMHAIRLPLRFGARCKFYGCYIPVAG